MQKSFLLFLTMASMVFFFGCKINPADKFVGKWIGVTKSFWDGGPEVVQMNIEKNGDNFLVKLSTSSSFTSKPSEIQIGASLTADGKLKLDLGSLANEMVVYNEREGTLLWKGTVLQKETPEIFTRLKEQQRKFKEEKAGKY
ncbi:MAG: hypothetical protein HGB36_10360 [Chlorobiaceae bacterium]|jgi:hypothetical protein|nr:hypothetical protein [Chlorobiaceae bacterium]